MNGMAQLLQIYQMTLEPIAWVTGCHLIARIIGTDGGLHPIANRKPRKRADKALKIVQNAFWFGEFYGGCHNCGYEPQGWPGSIAQRYGTPGKNRVWQNSSDAKWFDQRLTAWPLRIRGSGPNLPMRKESHQQALDKRPGVTIIALLPTKLPAAGP